MSRKRRGRIHDIIIIILHHTKDDESHALHALTEVLGVVGELVQSGLACKGQLKSELLNVLRKSPRRKHTLEHESYGTWENFLVIDHWND
jgi:hypothetical protein